MPAKGIVNNNPCNVFFALMVDGKPTLRVAVREKVVGNYWHIRCSSGKTIKLNGGCGWSLSDVGAWNNATNHAILRYGLVRAGLVAGDAYAEEAEAMAFVRAGLEDVASWSPGRGTLREIERRQKINR